VVTSSAPASPAFLARGDLDALVALLAEGGRRVIGPTVSDGAIVYDEIRSVGDLPAGWRDEQRAGSYRLRHEEDERQFAYAVGPTSWKRFTFPPTVPIGRARQDGAGVRFEAVTPEVRPMAFLGVRACELAALRVQDRVLSDGPFTDADYAARRSSAIVVAVQCTHPASACFCTSMGTGPEVRDGFDLALTELENGFLVEEGSPVGVELLARLPVRPAERAEREDALVAVETARSSMGHAVAASGLPGRLLDQLDSPRWAEVAERCLSCTNCTLVCPTCFCTSVDQRSDLTGADTITERRWDSCFSDGFARVAGGDFRPQVRDRYRQWLTHKFATWVDQFGTSGCVGCGRCIAWCPAAIDVREELAAIAPVREGPAQGLPATFDVREEPVRVLPAAPVATVPGSFSTGTVGEVRPETADTSTLVLADLDPAICAGGPGQFLMVARPAFPAVPISVSRYLPDGVELSIRAAGPATGALTGLTRGAQLGLRGPLGRGWAVEEAVGHDVVVVGGGIGLAPLRPVIDAVLAHREAYRSVRIFYGARTPADRLYRKELAGWAAREDVEFLETVDRAGPEWLGRVGVVTQLFDQAGWDGRGAYAFVCGPERMMQAAVTTLASRGLSTDRIHLSLERHMECGIGLCGHCQMGRYFICKDGPVFSLAELGDDFGRHGL
jgi:NAD(P)H-flavin reductase/Pyruvate/2-oxoacid:ferredoxin oxidoreductase delta subunit